MSDIGASFARAVTVAREAITASDLPEARLLREARWVGVEGETWWWSEQPDEPAEPEHGLWRSDAAGRLAANTRITEGGEQWAQVVLPLPEGDAALRLLVHEAWHAFGQAPSEHPETPGDGSLDLPRGRALLRCQLSALATALRGEPRAVADAERIRAARLASATDEERARQERLEDHEGRPESIAWEVSRGTDEQLSDEITADLADTSLSRTFAYFTEPARRRLLARGPRSRPAVQRLDEVLDRHDYDRILVDEEARAADRAEEQRRREAAYDGEVLRLRLDPPELVFDPRRVEAHRLGTWYGELRWRHPTGAELDVRDGCVVDSGWKTLLLPRPERGCDRMVVRGPGWTLTLPDGVALGDLTPGEPG